MKEWLDEYENVVNGISFQVNNADKLTKQEKQLVLRSIADYCHLIGKDEHKNQVVFTNECYTTGQEDVFREGTRVTRSFIANQNTIEMKQLAQKYSLVVSVLIDWKRK